MVRLSLPAVTPDTVIDSGPVGTVADTSATFTFHSTVTPATFECSLDSAAFSACSSPTTSSGLAPGNHTFRVRATANGVTDPSPASATWKVQVTFPFTGFFDPVNNKPVLNVAHAGDAIPVRFSLGGDRGLGIVAKVTASKPQAKCKGVEDAIEETIPQNSPAISYDPSTDRYTYTYLTSAGWAGTCRKFTLKLSDGSKHVASFKFIP